MTGRTFQEGENHRFLSEDIFFSFTAYFTVKKFPLEFHLKLAKLVDDVKLSENMKTDFLNIVCPRRTRCHWKSFRILVKFCQMHFYTHTHKVIVFCLIFWIGLLEYVMKLGSYPIINFFNLHWKCHWIKFLHWIYSWRELPIIRWTVAPVWFWLQVVWSDREKLKEEPRMVLKFHIQKQAASSEVYS